jgi:hypothetical protein
VVNIGDPQAVACAGEGEAVAVIGQGLQELCW